VWLCRCTQHYASHRCCAVPRNERPPDRRRCFERRTEAASTLAKTPSIETDELHELHELHEQHEQHQRHEQHERLIALGCLFRQGHLFGMPSPLTEFEGLLSSTSYMPQPAGIQPQPASAMAPHRPARR